MENGRFLCFFVMKRWGKRPFLGETAVIRESHLKRWRYALPNILHTDRCLSTMAEATGSPIIFAGDAFKEPRVEGAVLSGETAVLALKLTHKGTP